MAEGERGGVNINTCVLHDEEFELPCTMCLKKKRNKEAKYFCVDCNDNYCDTCIKVHNEEPALSRHRKKTKNAVITTNKNRLEFDSCFSRKV
jgi:hypothetical protein